MCARIGMVTGMGLGDALRRKGPRWLLFGGAVGLLGANTINVGSDLSGMADAAEMLTGINFGCHPAHLCSNVRASSALSKGVTNRATFRVHKSASRIWMRKPSSVSMIPGNLERTTREKLQDHIGEVSALDEKVIESLHEHQILFTNSSKQFQTELTFGERLKPRPRDRMEINAIWHGKT